MNAALALERSRILDLVRNHPDELAALQKLAAPAAAAGHFILPGADRLLRAAAGLDAHDVPVAGGGDEAEHAIVVRVQLDEDDALARAGQVVHFLGGTQDGTGVLRRDDDRFLAGDLRDTDDLDAV